VHNWYRAVTVAYEERDVSAADEASEDLLRRLRESPTLLRLAGEPLYLTMIVNVHRYRGALPGSLADLYHEIIDVVLWRRDEAKQLPSRISPTQMKDALSRLAFTLMIRRERAFTGDEVAAELPVRDRAVLLEQVRYREVLLDEVEPGRYRFIDISLQEYLAASHLRDSGRGEMLIDVVSDPWWRQTILFYASEREADVDALVRACLNDRGDYALALARDIADVAVEVAPELWERLYGPDR
jgi:predicted NACHT family NTPase